MCKIFWISLVAMVAMVGSVSAQEVPTECGGGGKFRSSCRFQCLKGDRIQVQGSAACLDYACCDIVFGVYVQVSASCGGVTVSCQGGGFCAGECQTTSADTTMADDENGLCTGIVGGQSGGFSCRSLTPEEAAELEASGQGIVIRIPE